MKASEAKKLSAENIFSSKVYYILQLEIEKAVKLGYYTANHSFSDETPLSIKSAISLLERDEFEVELYHSMNEFYVTVNW